MEHVNQSPEFKKYQHFRFDANHPRMVFIKKETDSEELEFLHLFQGMDFPQGHPMVIVPPWSSTTATAISFQ
ncbi:hypothetical protein SNE40_017437 [Patella caerulea]|uniref:Uncharacterized protein n=1 Tax=Patella caerulea TaxID=87958 RepID=A0AAN8JB50_PATCE